MRAPRLDQLEGSIKRIPGVQAATVMGIDSPSEIHIVAGAERSPKQLVRDIQSLASAGFGFAIDHRIVSIVRLEEVASPPEQRTAVDQQPPPRSTESAATSGPRSAAAEPPEQPNELRVDAPPQSGVINVDESSHENGFGTTGHRGARPVLEQMIFGLKDGATWAKVALRWPDGSVTQGVSVAGEAREVRARAAGEAFLKALQPYLQSRGAKLEIEQLLLHKSGARELVLVRAMFSDKGALTPLAGSAIIHDDVATATVHALLHASNRKLIALSV